ncbi:hypothetical protein MRX96_047180, partial [Rhipicephalus microplus]
LLFVFMVGTALLSMMFSNAATTAIVAPVVAALVEQMKCIIKLKRNLVPTSAAASLMASTPRVRVAEAYRKVEECLRASLVGLGDDCLVQLRCEMMMSMAYSASIGGTGVLSETPGHSIMTDLYKKYDDVSYAVKLKMHPMSLAMPVTLSSLFGFMLPASTSSNVIVYDMARMGVRDMVRLGFVLALICVTATILLSVTWGPVCAETSRISGMGHRQ